VNFNSLAGLASHFRRVERAMGPAIVHELEDTGKAIEADAKRRFGTYQTGWPPLADSTMAERVREGYTPDDPLFRSGALQEAITHKVEGESVFIGVEGDAMLKDAAGREVQASAVMAVHEFGDPRGAPHTPARPVFGIVAATMERFEDGFMRGVIARSGL
jgi:hypothetical protein